MNNNQRTNSRMEMRRQRSKHKKPFYKKIWFPLLILLLLIAAIVFSIPKNSNKSSSNNKTEQTTKNYSKINKSIAAKLKEDRGFANGTLDENGKPTDNGTPNNAFAWSNGIVKIKMADNSRINVHVVTEFKSLTDKDKNNIALKAQNISLIGLSKHEKVSQKKYHDGLYTVIYCDGDIVGKSKMSNYKDFKWNK